MVKEQISPEIPTIPSEDVLIIPPEPRDSSWHDGAESRAVEARFEDVEDVGVRPRMGESGEFISGVKDDEENVGSLSPEQREVSGGEEWSPGKVAEAVKDAFAIVQAIVRESGSEGSSGEERDHGEQKNKQENQPESPKQETSQEPQKNIPKPSLWARAREAVRTSDFTPQGLKNAIEAGDVRKQVSESESRRNVEQLKKEQVVTANALAKINSEIGALDSGLDKIARQVAEQKRVMEIRVSLLIQAEYKDGEGGEIDAAKRAFEDFKEAMEAPRLDLEKQKQRKLIERGGIEAEQKSQAEGINAEKVRMMDIVEGKVTTIKTETGYDGLVAERDGVRAQRESLEQGSSALDSRISALEALIKTGQFGKSQIENFKAKIAELRTEQGALQKQIGKVRANESKISKNIGVIDVRIGKIKTIPAEMGFAGAKKNQTVSSGGNVSNTNNSPRGGGGAVESHVESEAESERKELFREFVASIANLKNRIKRPQSKVDDDAFSMIRNLMLSIYDRSEGVIEDEAEDNIYASVRGKLVKSIEKIDSIKKESEDKKKTDLINELDRVELFINNTI